MVGLGSMVMVDGREGVIIDSEKNGFLVRLSPFKMEKVWVMKSGIVEVKE